MSETPPTPPEGAPGAEQQPDPYGDPTAPAWTEPVSPPPPPAAPPPGFDTPPAPGYDTPQAPALPSPQAPGYDAPPAPPAYPYGSPAENPYGAPAGDQGYGTAYPAPTAPYPSQDQYQQQYQQGQPAYGQPAYGQPAYGQPTYGQAPPGYGYPPIAGTPYGQSQSNTSALVLLIISILSIVFCGGLLVIPAAVFGGVALSRQSSDPESSRKLSRWGWIAYAIGIVASIIGVIIFFAFVINTGSSYSSYDTGY